jgi:hypothetical protein
MDPVFAKHDSFYLPHQWNAQSWMQYGGEAKDQLTDWTTLLALGDRVSARKLRLFLCACCRHMWPRIAQEVHRQSVEIGELFADGLVTDDVRKATYDLAKRTIGAGHSCCVPCSSEQVSVKTVRFEAKCAAGPQVKQGSLEKDIAFTRHNQLHNALLLRDVFGDIFRPVVFSPAWRADTVVSLARTMYDSREFSAMPILADALQDAGCDNCDILDHCRGPGPHVRGCWVVDLVLGKE